MVVDLQLTSWVAEETKAAGMVVLLQTQILWYVKFEVVKKLKLKTETVSIYHVQKIPKKTNQVTMTNTKQLTTLMKSLPLYVCHQYLKSLTFLSFPGKVFELCHPFQPAKFGFLNTRSGMISSWNGKVYIYIFFLLTYTYIHITYPTLKWSSYQTLKIMISLFRHVSLVHLFSCFLGYNNVTYKNKQESSWQNYLGRGYEYPHNHFQERHDMMNPSRLVNRHCQYDSTYLGTNADMFLLVPAPSRLIVMSMMS